MSPQKKDHTGSGAAIAGAGGTTAAAGLAGGGIPGVKSKAIMADVKDASNRRGKAKAATNAYRGGEFGYRHNAHHTFNVFGINPELKDDTTKSHYKHGFDVGRKAGEAKIIPHLQVARRASNAALVGGAGLTAYGVHRATKKEPVKKRDNDRQLKGASGAALGVGGTVAAGSVGTARVLERQGRKWSKQAVGNLEDARKIAPNAGGHVVNPLPDKVKNKRVPDIGAEKGSTLVGNTGLAGKTAAEAHEVGRLRGEHGQARYFAATYGGAAKLARKARNPALAVAGLGGGGLAVAHHKDKGGKVFKKRLMSDAEIKRRKRAQGHLSQAGGAIGLAALGGTLAASRTGRNTLRKIPALQSKVRAPKPLDPERDKIQGVTTPLLATGAGLGGIGSFNFASYTNAESRKRTMNQPVKKQYQAPLEMGYYGEEGHPVTLPPIEVPIEKAWSPSAGNFDSERSRQKRSKAYQGGALVGAGAAGAYAGHHGMKAVHQGSKVKSKEMAEVHERVNSAKQPYKIALGSQGESAVPLKHLKPALKHGGKAAAGVAVVAGAAGAHRKLKRKQTGDWSPYAKRDVVSAFGIDHAH